MPFRSRNSGPGRVPRTGIALLIAVVAVCRAGSEVRWIADPPPEDRIVAESNDSTTVFRGAFDCAVVPNFVGDDLIYDPARAGGLSVLHVPGENVLLGMMRGEDAMLVLCWLGEAQVELPVAESGFAAISVGAANIHAGLIEAPGIWHAAKVAENDYERDVLLEWKPPFPARWLAQFEFQTYTTANWTSPPRYLDYDGTSSTFAFDGGLDENWRATVGYYPWPCWTGDGQAFFHTGQKVLPPSPRPIVYHLERNADTPADRKTPEELVSEALGKDRAEELLGYAGRERFSLYRPDTVYGCPTCGTTAIVEKIFKARQECENRAKLDNVADDLMYYFERMMQRLKTFDAFAGRATEFRASHTAPEAVAFLDAIGLQTTADTLHNGVQLPEVKDVLPSVAGLLNEFRGLLEAQRPDNYDKYMKLKGEITHRGGLVDSFAARGDFLLRGLAQQAGYRCVDSPAKAQLAREVRVLVREYLRNPTPWEQAR